MTATARKRAGALLALMMLGSCGSSGKMMMAAPEAASDEAMAGGAEAGGDDDWERVEPPPQVAAVVVRDGRPQIVDDARAGEQEWAVVREFPVPDYSLPHDGPRADFRETVYWAPAVRTGADGRAEVSFFLSDAVTTFRASAEGFGGGAPGRGEAVIASRLPVALDAVLPLEVSHGDVVRVPVTITNASAEPFHATLHAELGAGLRLRGAAQRRVWLRAGASRTIYVDANVVGDDGRVTLQVRGGGHADALERAIAIRPPGFPQRRDVAGTLARRARHELEMPAVVDGSLDASITFYPSPVAAMVEGTEALIAEPTGCFEQASSANYPNVMVMRYLAASDAAKPELVQRTRGMLDRGYAKLAGYESPSKGYEWFGADPGHEALTAYGLMQFADMAAVHDVDPAMVERTQKWLLARRDGNGGYTTSRAGYHSWAHSQLTELYITYALVRTGVGGLDKELDVAARVAGETDDPYELALAAGALVHARDGRAAAALGRLVAMQRDDGSFTGAATTITNSGGYARDIETTALAALALLGGRGHTAAADRAVQWLASQRRGGSFGSTQATVLALQALAAHAGGARLPAGATVDVVINGEVARTVAFEAGGDAVTVDGLAPHLRPGRNVIELRASHELELPYSATVAYRVARGPDAGDAPIRVTTALRTPPVTRIGKPVKLVAMIANTSAEHQGSPLARIGIPGGLVFQTWQLDELRARGTIAFYETREREVILYFRELAPGERRQVELELLAAVAGDYTAPPSVAYPYYTDELKAWADPIAIRITRPWTARRKHAVAK